jgi:hypothetical protein
LPRPPTAHHRNYFHDSSLTDYNATMNAITALAAFAFVGNVFKRRQRANKPGNYSRTYSD